MGTTCWSFECATRGNTLASSRQTNSTKCTWSLPFNTFSLNRSGLSTQKHLTCQRGCASPSKQLWSMTQGENDTPLEALSQAQHSTLECLKVQLLHWVTNKWTHKYACSRCIFIGWAPEHKLPYTSITLFVSKSSVITQALCDPGALHLYQWSAVCLKGDKNWLV